MSGDQSRSGGIGGGRSVVATLKGSIKDAVYQIHDGMELLLGKRDRLTPPQRLIYVGAGSYRVFTELGDKFARFCIEQGGLRPDHRILDVGCGIGRVAIPLARHLGAGRYLDATGSYEGIDIVPHGIEWCEKNITPRFPNFHFQLADVYNQFYNPAGRNQAREYRFPFSDGEFDFVYLCSVFTHMKRDEMTTYLREVVRVLKPAGRCVITFFLLNSESIQLMAVESAGSLASGLKKMNFRYEFDGYRAFDKDVPERTIAYDEDVVQELYSDLGLRIEGPIYYGDWCGRKTSFNGYQDFIVATKVDLPT